MPTTQTIFDLLETKGVLVVTPLGDAVGYRDADVAREVEGVLKKIDSLPRVVVNLGRSNYFGSTMIGAVNAFAGRATERDGAFAVCLLSEDMRQVLQVMKLDERWPQFDSQKAAVKFVQKTSG